MNREIKFRFWHKLWKCYLNPDLIFINGNARYTLLFMGLQEQYLGFPLDEVNIIPLQYTSFKDVNLQEIYEGDIIGGVYLGIFGKILKIKAEVYFDKIYGWSILVNDFEQNEISEKLPLAILNNPIIIGNKFEGIKKDYKREFKKYINHIKEVS